MNRSTIIEKQLVKDEKHLKQLISLKGEKAKVVLNHEALNHYSSKGMVV